MLTTSKLLMTLVICCIMFGESAFAQPSPEMSAVERNAVLDSLSITLEKNYAFPKQIASIMTHLKKRNKKGNYSSANTPSDFAELVTNDLQEITKDLHFFVGVDPDWIADQRKAKDPEFKKALAELTILEQRQQNFGFEDVQLLEGNIGYLNFSYFADPDYAHETAEAAMRLLENAEALIIDQRFLQQSGLAMFLKT